jgi:putative oxygen-independent coproporphyrinogen III oxidase
MYPIPLSLYIHFPWCIRKCPYCDFNSFALNTELDETRYIQALVDDLQQDLHFVQDREIISIFMGGGTPSLFSPESMDILLTAIRKNLNLTQHCEITMEMNPGAVEYGNLKTYRDVGINRLSIGVQSFNPQQLQKLGRVHNEKEAIAIAEKIKDAGFDNFNLDLMYALPGQTVEEALLDLQQAIQLQPQHLSWYHLTIEPNTEFYRRPPQLPDEDTSIAIENAGKELLKQNEFQQYEVSAYSIDTHHQAAHNRNYWEFGDYLGIGAGAHSKITDLNTGIITRYWKQRTPKNYLGNNNFVAGERVLTDEDKIVEFMFNALRLTDGFCESSFNLRTGLNIDVIESTLNQAKLKGLLEIKDEVIRPTVLGGQFLNDLINLFSGESR